MYYAVINKPPENITDEIESFRQRYDQQHTLIPAHVTIVFPITSQSLDLVALKHHLKVISEKQMAFDVKFNQTELSFDQFLFLTPESKQEIINLHDILYTKALAQFLRTDIKFIPHIGLGQFTTDSYDMSNPSSVKLDKSRYNEAISELKKIEYTITYTFDNIELISINDNFTKVQYLETYKFGGKDEV